ncbi:MAG TPA: hypothetical protein ENK66_07365 [Arcobacter sp.]|nr:hypothetical protein [Arcobacter sp.]
MSKINNDDLEKYLIQVQGKRLKGSGVLFKYHTKTCIFTAKHNFEFYEGQQVQDIELEEIKRYKDKVKISPYDGIKILDVIGLDDVYIDFMILIVDEKNSQGIENLNIDTLNIFDSGFNGEDIIIGGYPTVRTEESTIPIEYFKCSYESSKDNIFEVYSEKVNALREKDKNKTIVGISGAGVFVNNDNQLSLVGIEIRYEGLSNLVCINLVKLKDEIDSKLIYLDLEYIQPHIILDNGKSLKFEMVKVDLEDKSLYVSTSPVTFESYDLFCMDKGKKKVNDRAWGRGKRPVIYVSFKDAKKYCKWLTDYSSRMEYKLPSSTDWLSIAELNSLNVCLEDSVWYNKIRTVEAGTTKLGKLGIYDMYGNIEEWCSDNVSIGGSFRNTSLGRIREKIKRNKTDKFDYLGFRVIAKYKEEQINMSDTANGQKKLLELLKTSNDLFKNLQEITKENSSFNLIPPQNMKEAERLIRKLGSRDLLKVVKEIEQRLYERKD